MTKLKSGDKVWVDDYDHDYYGLCTYIGVNPVSKNHIVADEDGRTICAKCVVPDVSIPEHTMSELIKLVGHNFKIKE